MLKVENLKTKIKLLLMHGKRFMFRYPGLVGFVLALLARFPALKAPIRRMMMAATSAEISHPEVAPQLASLTPHARRIFAGLNAAGAAHSKANNGQVA